MDQNLVLVLLGLAYLVGSAGRVFGRYAIEWGYDPQIEWSWRLATGQIVASVFGLLPTLITAGQISELLSFANYAWVGYLMAAIAGYGAASVGRAGQLAPGAYKAWKNGS